MSTATESRVRLVAGALATADIGLLAVMRRRPGLVAGFVGPKEGDLFAWSAGVIATYTAAQAVIAVRPSSERGRTLAAMRLALIGGDLMLARRGRTVDRRLGILTAVGNGLCASAAVWSAGRCRTVQGSA